MPAAGIRTKLVKLMNKLWPLLPSEKVAASEARVVGNLLTAAGTHRLHLRLGVNHLVGITWRSVVQASTSASMTCWDGAETEGVVDGAEPA